MSNPKVDVLASGAVCLGSNVVCDGFAEGVDVRVQTHLHEDHMADFTRSKGLQDIFLSPESYELLKAEYNAEIPYRANLHRVERGTNRTLKDGSKLTLMPSGHMLGASQVALELPGGYRVGYSGDFSWPLDTVLEVDELVVDSTYGSPVSVRNYTQAEAEACLIELVCRRLNHGSVHLNAHRGTIERVLNLLGGSVSVPIIASDNLIKQVTVYQQYGYAAASVLSVESKEGQESLRSRAYVRLYSKGDSFGVERVEGTSITIGAYMANRHHPLMEYSDRAYRVALSNHADFKGTLEYVNATGAARVITDNTRGHGWELALAIRSELGVEARASSNDEGPRWR